MHLSILNQLEYVIENDCRRSTNINYYCPSGYTDNGSRCYYTTNASSYNTNYDYCFNDKTDTNASTCTVQSSFSCNSSHYNSSYVSKCTPTQWSCASGTKLNDNLCYKIGGEVLC